MRNDEYGAALEAALKQAHDPMTAAELTNIVGCSRQRTYTWLQANEAKVRTVGKDRAGGARYTWLDGKEVTNLNDAFRVASFFVDAGQVVLVLAGPDGSQYHARPA